MKWNVVGWLGLAVFLMIACSYNTEPLKQLDQWAANTFEGNSFMNAFHIIGNTETIIGITLVFALCVIITKKEWKTAAISILAVAFGYGLNQVIKGIFERPRPDIVDQLTSFSFPSAHAMGTTICLLTVVFLCQQIYFKGSNLYAVYTVTFILIVFVALSRVAGARHFFTDVTAGVSLGIAVVAMVTYFYKKWCR